MYLGNPDYRYFGRPHATALAHAFTISDREPKGVRCFRLDELSNMFGLSCFVLNLVYVNIVPANELRKIVC
jgi:hypothetical protein